MNPHISNLEADNYLSAVLTLYLGLPETPLRASTQDRRLARQLYERGVALHVVESAFLLASLRRLARPADVPALSPIRSLAYFHSVRSILKGGGWSIADKIIPHRVQEHAWDWKIAASEVVLV